MEKKTIGGFISALRKANGMTQKNLAERLNVSDKSVSRWENDEGAPDLSLIPVIAEIFGVTCDELLRGERKPPEERSAEENTFTESTPKGEKQRQRLLKTTLSKYQSFTYISMGHHSGRTDHGTDLQPGIYESCPWLSAVGSFLRGKYHHAGDLCKSCKSCRRRCGIVRGRTVRIQASYDTACRSVCRSDCRMLRFCLSSCIYRRLHGT